MNEQTETDTTPLSPSDLQGTDPTQEVPTADTAELLNSDLAGVSENMPLLSAGEYELQVAACVLDKSKTGSQMIKITLKTREVATAVNGERLPAGYTIFDQIVITPSEKLSKDSIARRLKIFRKACTGQDGGSFGIPTLYQDCIVKVVIKVQPAKDSYPERNVVGRYVTDNQ